MMSKTNFNANGSTNRVLMDFRLVKSAPLTDVLAVNVHVLERVPMLNQHNLSYPKSYGNMSCLVAWKDTEL